MLGECYLIELQEARKREMGKDAAAPLRNKEPTLQQLQGGPCTGEHSGERREMDPIKASAGENRVVPVEVTAPVPVDPKDPNKVLNVGSQLSRTVQNI